MLYRSTLFVSNLPYTATSTDLNTLFSDLAPVRSAFVVLEPGSGVSKGVGYVSFAIREDAQLAFDKIAQEGLSLDGRQLRAQWADSKVRMHLFTLCNILTLSLRAKRSRIVRTRRKCRPVSKRKQNPLHLGPSQRVLKTRLPYAPWSYLVFRLPSTPRRYGRRFASLRVPRKWIGPSSQVTVTKTVRSVRKCRRSTTDGLTCNYVQPMHSSPTPLRHWKQSTSCMHMSSRVPCSRPP